MRGLSAVFPARLFAANVLFTLMAYVALVVVAAIIAVAIGLFGDLGASVWEQAIQASRWFVLVIGTVVVRTYLPVYVANGRTRREFFVHAAVFLFAFAPVATVLIMLGYLMETGLYGLGGWPRELSDRHLFGDLGQVPLVFAEYWSQYLVWVAVGAMAGAAFYRLYAGGILLIPVGAALIFSVHAATDLVHALPVIGRLPVLGLPATVPVAVGVGLAGFLIAIGLTWAFVRDIPIRNPR
ncbi:hypothetical protein [Spongiactinospora sp. TRM90649]|uniref:hypothetical protein n=1 Tax=Spongiactinospora sp. TRM90649 TaxID=3031114 RepID=UPI0023F9F1D1|nr:hypothetical protein [Spongiactinospora sp. TRM90649]MDF5757981.1 hypothetical protein [Spongiactinospora sp. TRM90649]